MRSVAMYEDNVPMNDVFWLIPGRLAGRPGPDYAPWSLPVLRAAGIQAVINLSEFEPPYAAFADAGISVQWTPLPNTYPANADTEVACEERLPAAFDFLRSRIDDGQAVLVHCAWGRDGCTRI